MPKTSVLSNTFENIIKIYISAVVNCFRYDRVKLQLKDIHNCQYVSCMNPTAGSFTINPRLQRHFCVFAVNFPSGESLTKIYTDILVQHLSNPHLKFPPTVVRVAPLLITAAMSLHQKMAQQFLPTAVKFHYIFNLRDLSNIFQVQWHFIIFSITYVAS